MAEQTLILGAEQHLVATLTPAAGGQTPRCVAVLTNSGVIPRSGPHRMNVHLARQFAEIGIASIRFDMSGLGDSRRSSSTQPLLDQWVADTRAVMDLAQAQFNCDRFVMVGFCSGAEVAHLVGLEDPRLRAALLWDLYAYPTPQSRLRKLVYRLRRAGLVGLVQKLIARMFTVVSQKTDAASTGASPANAAPSQAPAKALFAQRIQTLVDGGMELMFAFSGAQPEWFNHPGQFKDMFGGQRFVDQVAFNYLERCDHLITRREAQALFSDMTVQWLKQRVLTSKP
jgi:pimeloyl-ACP methyl ester carboxylesterase